MAPKKKPKPKPTPPPRPVAPSSYLGYGKGETPPSKYSYGRGGGGPQGFQQEPIARYSKGAEWGAANLAPNEISNIQQALVAGGWATDSGLSSGVWDKRSADAMAKVMGAANHSGQDWQTTLNTSLTEEEAGGGSKKQGSIRQAPTLVTGGAAIAKPNSIEVSETMRKGFRDALGRNPKPEEELRFVESVQNQDVMAQALEQNQQDQTKQAAYMQDVAQFNAVGAAQGAAEGGADVVIPGGVTNVPNKIIDKPASPEAQALWEARTKYPDEYNANDAAKRLGTLMSMMRSSAPGGTATMWGR